jgi:aryl-alcohol dehydrogenase-like predicted oxidoreductase
MANRAKCTRREFLLSAAAAPVVEYRRGGMVYRKLGRTGLDVSLLSFGSHTDPKDRVTAGSAKTVLTEAGQARRDRILSRAFDFGVNLLDVYASEGQWEPAARMVRGRRDKVLVSLAHEITPQEVDRAAKMFGHVDLYRFHAPDMGDEVLHNWDTLRKAKEAGKVRAIGIATHIESTMSRALDELDDLDFIYFPYNFIHARADYGSFLPRAVAKQVGLIAMKPLASGSIMRLDPRARPGAAPEFEQLQLWQSHNRPILPAAVAELTKSLDRMADETLCMAAMRFVYAKPFISTAIAGMFEMPLLEDNYKALERYRESRPAETAALDHARQLARACEDEWLPRDYRWLEKQWRG